MVSHEHGIEGYVGSPVDLKAELAAGKADWVAKARREHIAAAVLAGFASIRGSEWTSNNPADSPVKRAVAWADALIAELDK